MCEWKLILKKKRKEEEEEEEEKKKKEDYSTQSSQVVSNPSTNRARRGLTSLIGREVVLSSWYGRNHYSSLLFSSFSLPFISSLLITHTYPPISFEWMNEWMFWCVCVCVCVCVFASERVRGAKYMKRCCAVVWSRTSKVGPAKQRLWEYLKEQTNEQRKMACNLFHCFPI